MNISLHRSRLLLGLMALSPPAGAATEALAPLDFLLGHCWQAEFDARTRDIQCFTPLYDGKLVHNTHMVLGTEPPYEGLTLYSWDPDNARIRFHYFTSTGAVSEGHAEPIDGGLRFPERHVGRDGTLTELDTTFRPDGASAYTVVTRQRTGGAWSEVRSVRYQRMESGGARDALLPLGLDGVRWTLAWNRQQEGWGAVYRAEDGQVLPLTRGEGSHWLWDRDTHGLLMLCAADESDAVSGWRACRGSASSNRDRMHAAPLGDGLLTCHPNRDECLVGLREDDRRRLVRITRSGKPLGALFRGDWDDADPQWSSSGDRLLFRSNRSGSWELWLMEDGIDAPRRLTGDPANDLLAAHAYQGEGPARFAPDGRWIVWMRKFGDGFDVWRMEIDTGVATNLTADHTGDDGYPAVSPDGLWIAFDSDREGAGGSAIYVMPARGGAPRRISYTPGQDLAPLWIPLPMLQPQMPQLQENP